MRHNTEAFIHLVGKLHGKLVKFLNREQAITANLRELGNGE